ncbi:MAG: TIGR02453 family protein [Rhodospirillales bacterium]|nr:TIGR02453 family protein [Rhodospirillales bacterium]
MPAEPHFTPRLFKFLRELKRNNERAWFQANKDRYIAEVQEPMLRFIADFAAPLARISKHFDADPRPSGGSMFRIYRDTRFSKDKSPYKTHVAAHFRHKHTNADVHGPGFYFHLDPGECFIGGGLWLPAPPSLKKVRDSIAYDPKSWGKVRRAVKEIEGEGLTRPPQGDDPPHPVIDDLKRKSFLASGTISDAEVIGAGFRDRCAEACRSITPLMKFLTEAVELDW